MSTLEAISNFLPDLIAERPRTFILLFYGVIALAGLGWFSTFKFFKYLGHACIESNERLFRWKQVNKAWDLCRDLGSYHYSKSASLRESFLKYGAHLPTCDSVQDASKACSCGYTALFKNLSEPDTVEAHLFRNYGEFLEQNPPLEPLR